MTRIGGTQRMPTPPVDQTATIAAVRNDASRDGGGFASQLSSLDLDSGDKPVGDDNVSTVSDMPVTAKPDTGLSALLAAFNDGADPQITPSATYGTNGRALATSSSNLTGRSPTHDVSLTNAALRNALASSGQQAEKGATQARAVQSQGSAMQPIVPASAESVSVQQALQTLTQQSDTKTASGSSELPLPALVSRPSKASANPPQTSDADAMSAIASLLSSTNGSAALGRTTADNAASMNTQAGKSSRSLRPADTKPMASSSDSSLQDLASSAQAAIAILSSLAPPAATTGGTSGTGSQAAAAPVGGRASTSGQNVSSKPSPTTNVLANSSASSKFTGSASELRAASSPLANVKDNFDLADVDDSGSQVVKMHVSSIQAETHLIPVQAPAQQIADFIAANASTVVVGANAAGGGQGSSGTAPTPAASGTGPASTLQSNTPISSPVKILTLTLEPDTLGAVTVTMRLVDSGLSLQLGAAKSDTADLIERDKDKISDSLRSLGYAIDGVEVKTVATQSSNSTSTNDQAATSQGQPSASDAGASGLSQNGSGSRGDRSSAQARNDSGNSLNQDDLVSSSARRADGGLYL